MDKAKNTIFKIGWTVPPNFTKEAVVLEDNEVIVGVIAKLWKHW